MACGNSGDEGETGRTINTLMISPGEDGFDEISINPRSTTDRIVISDFVVTLTLG